MRFKLHKASDYDFKDEVEIKTLEDLKAVQDKYGGHDLIVDFNEGTISPSIWIYDGYME